MRIVFAKVTEDGIRHKKAVKAKIERSGSFKDDVTPQQIENGIGFIPVFANKEEMIKILKDCDYNDDIADTIDGVEEKLLELDSEKGELEFTEEVGGLIVYTSCRPSGESLAACVTESNDALLDIIMEGIAENLLLIVKDGDLYTKTMEFYFMLGEEFIKRDKIESKRYQALRLAVFKEINEPFRRDTITESEAVWLILGRYVFEEIKQSDSLKETLKKDGVNIMSVDEGYLMAEILTAIRTYRESLK